MGKSLKVCGLLCDDTRLGKENKKSSGDREVEEKLSVLF